MENYKYGNITEKVIGYAMKVHKEMGSGFQEVIYQRCLDIESEKAGLSFSREQEMTVYYDNVEVGTRRADFLVENKVLVELKAITKPEDVHFTQAINYLEAYKLEVGLLINFGAGSLEFKRIIKTKTLKC